MHRIMKKFCSLSSSASVYLKQTLTNINFLIVLVVCKHCLLNIVFHINMELSCPAGFGRSLNSVLSCLK